MQQRMHMWVLQIRECDIVKRGVLAHITLLPLAIKEKRSLHFFLFRLT